MRPLSFVLFFVLFLLSCQKNSDLFAEFNNGIITRSEFNDWLQSRNIPVKSVYEDRYAVSDYLRQIAVEKLTAARAEKAGFEAEKSYKIIENTLYKNLLATYFENKVKSELNFVEKAADISLIRIFLKQNFGKKNSAEEENKKRIIYNILSELKSGKDFNDLAGKYSEDAASQKKGSLGIVPENVMEDGIRNAISTLDVNEYTKEPVIVGNSLCLIKLHQRYNLTEKNIKAIVKDKENVQRIIDYYTNKVLNETLNKILKEREIVSNIDNALFNNRNGIIFSIDGEKFFTSDLDEILKLFYSLKYGVPADNGFSLNEKKLTSKRIFKESIFASEAKKMFIDDYPDFKRDWQYLKRATLAGSYKYSILLKNDLVTNKEVRDEYFQNKTLKYFITKKIKTNKEIKEYLTFEQARIPITKQLSREKLKSLKKNWDSEILNANSFKIVNKDFLVN
jgi:parvulin-like peptidyl-prolyl isomerase